MTMVIHTHTHTHTCTHTHTGHTQTHRHTHTHIHTHTHTHIHAVADPGEFPRFLETSQNLQHVGWVWSIIMGVVNYYWRNRNAHKHFSNQAPKKDEISKHSEQ